MDRLFGSKSRTRVLVLLAKLERTYASELARALNLSLRSVQTILAGLEEAKIIVGIPIGRTRFVQLNPRDPSTELLRQLLLSLADSDESILHAAESIRRSPRKRGKPL